MTTLNDNIIQAYINHPKTDDLVQRPCFKELSDKFHTIFRQSIARGKALGLIAENLDPMPGFWKKWGAAQESENNELRHGANNQQ